MTKSMIRVEWESKTLDSAFKDWKEDVAKLAIECNSQMAKRVAFKAQENVWPGVGPGPHPHISDHIDTGNLAESIKWSTSVRAIDVLAWRHTKEVARVYVTPGAADYGLYLELGWHTKTGRFVRYPWLSPALRDEWQGKYRLIDSITRQFKGRG